MPDAIPSAKLEKCDLCSEPDPIALWHTTPFEHRSLMSVEVKPILYSHPWALCGECDALISAGDREGLRERMEPTKRRVTTDVGLDGAAAQWVREDIDRLHDEFIEHATRRESVADATEAQRPIARGEPVSFQTRDRIPGMPGAEPGIAIESGVNLQGKPFCHVIVDGKPHGQLTPNEVRRMAMNWLEAAEAAEHDSAVFRFLTSDRRPDGHKVEAPLSAEGATMFIGDLRHYRGDAGDRTVRRVTE